MAVAVAPLSGEKDTDTPAPVASLQPLSPLATTSIRETPFVTALIEEPIDEVPQ